jgi:hypothetical protein
MDILPLNLRRELFAVHHRLRMISYGSVNDGKLFSILSRCPVMCIAKKSTRGHTDALSFPRNRG